VIPAALLIGLALAQDPDTTAQDGAPRTCDPAAVATLPTPEGRTAVAWVAPWGRSPRGWLTVVPARELRAWVAAQDPPWTGRTLQWLGLRKRNTDPKRRWKVVILEVEAEALCRPVIDAEKGEPVAGLPGCPARLARPDRRTRGCGRSLDRRTGEDGAPLWAVRRRDAEASGYCVVPLDRYLRTVREEAARSD
jgi:hypothetical protein